MRFRLYILAAAAAVVVIGGIYLWLDVRGTSASGPSPDAVAAAAARARHAQVGSAGGSARLRRPGRGSDGDGGASGEGRRTAGFPRPRPNLPFQDPAIFDRAPSEPSPLTDRLRANGPQQPAIDPDNPELASAMTEANKMYDRGDYEGARSMALKLLGREPTNVRMLRVVVSSSCILGDADVATQHWNKLPAPDQQTMAIRCARYQVTFPGAGTVPPEK